MSNSLLQVFSLGFPWQTQDPFLFCVYHLDHYPKGNGEMEPDQKLLEGRSLGSDFTIKDGWRMYHGTSIPGFPSHPHRGFETITIVNKGYCDHSDSLGAAGRFGDGDVQWMTAGRGVQHSEMFPLLNDENENPLELFQIWLNLPKKDKFTDPHFKMLWHEDIPIIKEENAAIKVIAGTYKNTIANEPAPNSWAATKENDVAIWNIHIEAASEFTLPKAHSEVTRTLYFYEGDFCEIETQKIQPNFGIALNGTQKTIVKTGAKKGSFLLLQGKPIAEPVAKYGPFVMNTDTEVQQAIQEYRTTPVSYTHLTLPTILRV